MRDFELRWFVKRQFPDDPSPNPVLQYRYREEYGPANALGRAWRMTEWANIPTEHQT
jgi:hypothetical protein